MKNRQIKPSMIWGILATIMTLGVVLLTPQTTQAYDVVTDIVTVVPEDGTDFNVIYDKYKDHSIIELPKGTYTLSDTLTINDPVIIRAAEGLSADDVIIDGGAKAETADIIDEVWQMHLKLIRAAFSGETVDYNVIYNLIPMALVKYPQSETGRGAKLWQWVRQDLLDLTPNYAQQGGYDEWETKNQEELGEIPFQIKQSIRYKRNVDYFNSNKAAILNAFNTAFSEEISDDAFKHQLHMDNPYAMIQGVTLQHFMGFQMFDRDQKWITGNFDKDYYERLVPKYASAISINGSLDRVKVVKNFMGDILAVDDENMSKMNGSYYNYEVGKKYNRLSRTQRGSYEYNGTQYYWSQQYPYEQTSNHYNELPSPIFLVNGGSVSNSEIAYNGQTFFNTEGTVKGNFFSNNTVDGSRSTVDVAYNAGDFVAMATYGYTRLTNNTIVNNNAKWNFLAINGDLVMQNNILLTLTTDGNYQSAAGQCYQVSSGTNKNLIYDLHYQSGGRTSYRSWNGSTWYYGLNLDYATTMFGIVEAGLQNYEVYFADALESLDGLFTTVPASKTGYRSRDKSLNDELSYDLTPISDKFVDKGVDCYYPQVGNDIKGQSRIQNGKPDLGAIEATGSSPTWSRTGVTDDFYITLEGAGDYSGKDWANAYAGGADIQYGIILAHRAGAKNVYVGVGDFKVQGKPYLYSAYANSFVTTVWDGVVLAPTADSLMTDTTKGMNLIGKKDGDGNPTTHLIGQYSSMLKSEIGTFPYEANAQARLNLNGWPGNYNENFRYSWQYGNNGHSARTTYGTRVVSQVEPVKGTVDGVVIENGYVATALPTQTSPRWTISEELANHNLAKGGGGAYLWNGTIKNSIIKNNYEARAFINRFSCGGGIFLNESSTMENTKVINNFSETTGGGVLAAGSNTTVKNSLIAGNIALEDGGGLATGAQPATEQANNPIKIINTVINGNYALGLTWDTTSADYQKWSIVADNSKGKGGGLLLHDYAEVKNATIVDNFAYNGDNVYMAGGLLKNTAIYSTYSYSLWSSVLADINNKIVGTPGTYENSWTVTPGDYAAIETTLKNYLPSLSLQRSGNDSNNNPNNDALGYTMGQEFKHFIIPRLQARRIESFVDVMIDSDNEDNVKTAIQNNAFKTVVVSDSDALIDDVSSIGEDNVIYTDMESLFSNVSYKGIESNFAHEINSFGLDMYLAVRENEMPLKPALVSASLLANKGTSDTSVTEDYFGANRASRDIGAFTSREKPIVSYFSGVSADEASTVSNLPAASDELTAGADYTISNLVPIREGYVFTGWQADADDTVYQASAEIKGLQVDLNLTAQWAQIYTVTYVAGTASAITDLPVADTAQAGEVFHISETEPKRIGYLFKGWQILDSEDTTLYQAGAEIESVSSNLVLTARWQKIGTETPVTTLNVTYQAGTDETVSQMPINAIVEQGASYTLASKIPIRQGYLFTGWQSADDTLYQPNASLQNIQADVTLVAQWQAISGFQVIYQAGTDAAVKDLPISAEIEVGADYTLSDLRPKRDGYKFTGWLADDTEGTLYQPSARLTNVQGNLVLTAQWEKVKAEVDKEAEKETTNQSDPPTSSSNADEKQSLKAKEKLKTLHLLPMTGEVYHAPVFLIIVIGGISVGLWCWKIKQNRQD